MPMSQDFQSRLFLVLRNVVREFGTPFHIYDERGIADNGWALKKAFSRILGFKEFFAVKACPNLEILKMMKAMGFGFDCSSIPELKMCHSIGVEPLDIMFTSNNTSHEEFLSAQASGAILNLDDIIMVPKVPRFPELICFRYNPGAKRTGNTIIGNPEEAKYGVRDDQIVDAYRLAIKRGAKRFGLHTMLCSNQSDYKYMVETVRMLLEIIARIWRELGIQFEFINVGGGIGIPYHFDQPEFSLSAFATESAFLVDQFRRTFGYAPKFFMESGRYMTGPYGALITTVINRMHKYREYVGVDACMSSLMRPALYDAWHEETVVGGEGRPMEVVDVVGSLCENNDKFAKQRRMAATKEGDLVAIHDTGAHGYAMCFTYNGRLRPKELMLCRDGSVRLIRREETFDDYMATQTFAPHVMRPT